MRSTTSTGRMGMIFDIVEALGLVDWERAGGEGVTPRSLLTSSFEVRRI